MAKVNYLEESEEDYNSRMEWWRNSKFGMFIHWGPTSEGIIPEESEGRLDQIGKWIDTNGEAIYNTERLINYRREDSIRYSRRKNYALKMGELPLSILVKHVKPYEKSEVHLLGYYDQSLERQWSETNGLNIIVPPSTEIPDQDMTKAWVFRVKGSEI
ncbi:MAG: alpha-L-fucosidase [Cytophagales bacterium]|nr:alpha-L-fucosidase [Cytophagales bacterium]